MEGGGDRGVGGCNRMRLAVGREGACFTEMVAVGAVWDVCPSLSLYTHAPTNTAISRLLL